MIEVKYAEVDLTKVNGLSSCPVCAKILAVFNMPFEVNAKLELGKVSDLVDSDCPHVDWILNAKYMYGTGPRYRDREIGVYKHENSTPVYLGLSYSTKESSYWSTTQRLELAASRGDSQVLLPRRGRIVDPEWVNEDVVRSWYPKCQAEHGERCERPQWIEGIDPVYPGFLVDVTESRIVPFTPDVKTYISLSYTWGQTRNLKLTSETLDELCTAGALSTGRLAAEIPATIRHSFEVTKLLGERYLWVDSLCIVQDDYEAMRHELDNMGLIYANSAVCIVAAAGHDASFGLRGLRDISAARVADQVVVELADGEKMTGREREAKKGPPDFRSYQERAWTFQEFMLAKRRLIFDDGPVRWHCNCAGWHEELHFHPKADENDALGPELWYSGRWMRARVPTLSVLTDLVRTYNKRHLTFPEDALRAFSGVQAMLHRLFPGGLIYGHPEFYFDIALVWHAVHGAKRRAPSGEFSGDPLHDGLPSWSWMGWHGDTCFPWDLEFASVVSNQYGFLEPVTEWYAMSSPQSSQRRKIESQWYAYKQAVNGDAGDNPLPDGWLREAYQPPEWHKRRDAHTVPRLPRTLPRFSYYHPSDPEKKCWYPIPVLNREKTPELKPQTQYLYCVTSRAFFSADPAFLMTDFVKTGRGLIRGKDGSLVGMIFIDSDWPTVDDSKEGLVQIELVAIAKGWTTTLEKDLKGWSTKKPRQWTDLNYQNDQNDENDESSSKAKGESDEIPTNSTDKPVEEDARDSSTPLDEGSELQKSGGVQETEAGGEESDIAGKPSTGNGQDEKSGVDLEADASDSGDSWFKHLDSDDEHPEYWKEDKVDCYFVLWIKWKDGVAYRQASGRVLADCWDKYKEETLVELILG